MISERKLKKMRAIALKANSELKTVESNDRWWGDHAKVLAEMVLELTLELMDKHLENKQ